MSDPKIKGGHMHETGAVKLNPSEIGVNQLPDHTIALSEQVVEEIVDAYNKRQDN